VLNLTHAPAVHHSEQIIRPILKSLTFITMAHYFGTSQSPAGLDNSSLRDFGGKQNISYKSQLAMVNHSCYTADDAFINQLGYNSQNILGPQPAAT